MEQPRRAQARACIAAAVILLALAATSQADAARARSLDAAAIVRALAQGRGVEMANVEVHGDLRLPRAVDAPLILRNSILLGDIVGAHGAFSRVIDLSGTRISGRADFAGARFAAPFVFERPSSEVAGRSSFAAAVFAESARFGRASFRGGADFSGAQFHGDARFASSTFGGDSDFSLAGFDGGVTFTSARFGRSATFTDAGFGSVADFTAAVFRGPSGFANARFAARADFITAVFDAAAAHGPSADFTRASFEDGATFLLARFRVNGAFPLVRTTGDMDFQDASFNGEGLDVAARKPVADFSTARLLGRVSFAGSQLGGFVSFDQAFVDELDLTEAFIGGPLRLPLGRQSGGRIGTLRLDLEDAQQVEGPEEDDRPAREAALLLVEESARAIEDLETANNARAERLTLLRGRKGALARGFDYAVLNGIWGYGVRPHHQLGLIGVLLLAGASARWRSRQPSRTSTGAHARGVFKDIGDTIGALLRLNPPKEGSSAWRVTEYLVFKVLIVILVLNAANVWPVSRELIEGVF